MMINSIYDFQNDDDDDDDDGDDDWQEGILLDKNFCDGASLVPIISFIPTNYITR